MYSVNMNDIERFCLRLLLLHVPGILSFEDLKKFEGYQSLTFKKAAQRRGLLNDEKVWEMTLTDASTVAMPRQLRDLFAYICVFGIPSYTFVLFNKFKQYMCEDYINLHTYRSHQRM